MRHLFTVLIICILLFNCGKAIKNQPSKRLTVFVNPFIGTDGPGNTYPGATVPYGMVQLSPDIGIPGWDRIAGYFYQDSIITGFSHTHLSGTGAGDLYDILVMPTNSKFERRIEENNFKPFSHFSHDKEKASPGYYQVDLLDYQIKAGLTATERTGIHRYTFPKDSLSQIHIDLGYHLNWDKPTGTQIKVIDNQTIEGYRKSTGWATDQRLYFQIKLSKPFESYQLYQNDSLVTDTAESKNTKIILNYITDNDEVIVLKTGLSTANIEGAKLSIVKETPDFDFDKYRRLADNIWEKQLRKVTVKTDDEDQKKIFYTMLYQSMLAPTLLSDHNGNYKGANSQIMNAKNFDRYDTFSLWDTYRAAHPLYTILHPKRVSDMMRSLLAHYNETGHLPVWSMQGNETDMMIGYHAVPVIVDAYFKGIDFDENLAFKACKASALDSARQMDIYQKLGYIPLDNYSENWSASKTLEYAYDDWCIAQFAKDLGEEKDYQYFLKRSENWKNLYDSKSRFMRPKDKKGNFLKEFVPKEYSNYYCESNAWQYFWSVQHGIEGLIKKIGGQKNFERKLDSMFSLYPLLEDKLPIFSTGMIGQYAHGNEPSHHVAYLYNYVNQPSKTQKLIRKILTTQYKNQPNGHCGNEDCGQMSSWYVFSSMGFYPVNPAQGVYVIGAPLFDEVSIKLENGKSFTVKAIDQNAENKYVQSITLNNDKLNRYYITHNEIINGGILTFVMGNAPKSIDKTNMALSSKVYKK